MIEETRNASGWLERGRTLSLALVVLTSVIVPNAVAAEPILPLEACETAITKQVKDWRRVEVPRDVIWALKTSNTSLTEVLGDFNGDGRQDIALFLELGKEPKPDYRTKDDAQRIAVCLNAPSGAALHLIDKPGCVTYIYLARKGQRYQDANKKASSVYPADSVGAVCWEKTASVFLYESGTFRRIVLGAAAATGE